MDLKPFMKKYLDDVLVVAGCLAIIGATFLWSVVAGLYVVGLSLIGAGVVVRYERKRGEKK